jgi:hypothetical protein
MPMARKSGTCSTLTAGQRRGDSVKIVLRAVQSPHFTVYVMRHKRVK